MPIATTGDSGRLANAIARRLARLAVRATASLATPCSAALPVAAMGLEFRNPLGLAAGFDQTGALLASLEACGFGFIEIGTVMPSKSPAGGDSIATAAWNLACFRRMSRNARVGVSLGSRRDGFGDEPLADYLDAMRRLLPYADYLVANLTAPTAVERRQVDAEPCNRFLAALCASRDALARRAGRRVPLAVKVMLDRVSPTLLQSWKALGVDALIGVSDDLERIAAVAAWLDPSALISVGGIRSGNEIGARMLRGATLVQIYGALVKGGPFRPRQLLAELARHPEIVHQSSGR